MSKTCTNCRQQIADDAKFCNNCGAQQPPVTGSQQSAYTQSTSQNQGYAANQAFGSDNAANQGQQAQSGSNAQPARGEAFSTADVDKNRVISALAYFIFFLPLVAAPDSRFGRFHANQGLLLLILSVGGNFILNIIPFLDVLLVPLFSLFCFVLAIMGLVNTLNGKARELPIIGQYRLIT